ncbi:MAG TPA: P1 family peptidase [Gemmatimonadales bacterium]
MTPSITDVPGLHVGHWTDVEAATGCTVLLAPAEGIAAAACVRGRATGTRELDAVMPGHLVTRIHALLFTGGSAYGLGAADGVMRWLASRGRGFDVGAGVVPIVPTAVIFDLAVGEFTWPDASAGFAACEAAGSTVEEGSVGAGTGATVGKVLGAGGAMKSGVGTWSVRRDNLIVGALAVVNAFGDVRDAQGSIIAGARREGAFVDARRVLAEDVDAHRSFGPPRGNTTLLVAATNAACDRAGLGEVASMVVDALGQRITPVGTRFDGDVVFAVSTGTREPASAMAIEMLAQDAAAMAIERAVRLAAGRPGLPGLADRA